GVCTMAIAGRAVVHAVCGHDPRRLRRLAVRFSAPLLPGQDVVTTIWPVRTGQVAFEMLDSEGTVVLTNGLARVDA
ncbi:MAG: dehydratase, partial [Chloroflexi bacterium]|nr:dehydratase [Chloroflexota bacterium]